MNKLPNTTFHLCDLDISIINNLKGYFEGYTNFIYHHDDILKVYENLKQTNQSIVIVSPANSFGELSGGIDLIYLHYFGYNFQEQIQNKIINEPRKQSFLRPTPLSGMNIMEN